jgi:predicted transcriptional regulator
MVYLSRAIANLPIPDKSSARSNRKGKRLDQESLAASVTVTQAPIAWRILQRSVVTFILMKKIKSFLVEALCNVSVATEAF